MGERPSLRWSWYSYASNCRVAVNVVIDSDRAGRCWLESAGRRRHKGTEGLGAKPILQAAYYSFFGVVRKDFFLPDEKPLL